MSQSKRSIFTRLYVGNGAFDIVGKRKRWYVLFGVVLLICIASIIFRGFNLGIDFTGGTRIQMPANSASGTISQEAVKESFAKAIGEEPTSVQTVGTGESATIQVRSETLDAAKVTSLKEGLNADLKPTGGLETISDSAVSASWGGEITTKALIALAVFFIAVAIFLALYFEWSMAVAALVAVVHDVVITAGIYSLVGFEVSPATVIGLLTILGFSLYDTVVVFDKVKENTRGLLGLTRRTYPEAANLAVNQTLMRSINTSLIALLPVVGLLAIGVGLLGVGTLKDLALVQLTGMAIGALSSIYIATPAAVDLKMRDPRYKAQAARVRQRRDNLARKASGEVVSGGDVVESSDDESLQAELRREKALTAAAGVPSRTGKVADARRRPTGKKHR
ncbi:protein translocase subunit SecF [Actinosynnema sp. NPDC047251]|uniref:Protein-export membrane protein SecF n=1 Tax=Saccharothrix espanaensis (strain ATCC 51144 / DSM 44229 / JCM 9112 / NBRC 15066 / NRRL 15764) TaxID=1179773 RepID=K0JWC4_SACES|nr:protein translocase subunit SecF [Saccharothrix espanaensis]CCH29782.1 Protein-export membrane protein secF [Saccharothrix espanaensis DSM 44229]